MLTDPQVRFFLKLASSSKRAAAFVSTTNSKGVGRVTNRTPTRKSIEDSLEFVVQRWRPRLGESLFVCAENFCFNVSAVQKFHSLGRKLWDVS